METIKKYIGDFKLLLDRIECTDLRGGMINFPAAIGCACVLIRGLAGSGLKLMFIGNGGSAAICSHMATDFSKNGGIAAMAFNDASMLTCMGNDFGYEHVFAKPIELFAAKGDYLVAVSSSGQSRNILNAVAAARVKGCAVITLSGFKTDNPLRAMGDINFYVPVEHYGYVEVIHQYICHTIIDNLSVNINERYHG
ncbi:MAG: SIS domain-containing protein [Nitrospirae bacterium]|nr:SIS domain-containing protein [Nitrospirota bacterium]